MYLSTVGAPGCPGGFNSATVKMFGELRLQLLTSPLDIKCFTFLNFDFFGGGGLVHLYPLQWLSEKLYNSVIGNGSWLKALFQMHV